MQVSLNTDPGLNSKYIWTPNFNIFQLVDYDYFLPAQAVVRQMGQVSWKRMVTLKISATFTMSKFPFDTETLYFKMESWTFPDVVIEFGSIARV